jgi:hypothetical protein
MTDPQNPVSALPLEEEPRQQRLPLSSDQVDLVDLFDDPQLESHLDRASPPPGDA